MINTNLCGKIILFPLFMALCTSANAVILYSGDNSANQSAPDAARTAIYNAVARVTNATATSSNGTAVHIRGKYILTANHVGGIAYFLLNGSIYQRDPLFTPVSFGSVDMKLIKLIKDPGLPEIELYTGTRDIRYWQGGWQYATGTLIGWGRGRDPSDPSGPTWNWGDDSTIAKRWGTNRIEDTESMNYSLGGTNYTYQGLQTKLGSNNGENEAAMSYYDSGSGLFIEDSGTWKLAGLATLVQAGGSSIFSFATNNSINYKNYFVRIRSYASQIEAAIPDLSVYSEWQIDHSLYNSDAEDTADTDYDGVTQLLEFALGGDPNQAEQNILPVEQITEISGNRYLEITFNRPQNISGITYSARTTPDLDSWPNNSNGVNPPIVSANGDGTESVTFRRTLALEDADEAYMRVDVSY